jgi:hypothetical protein
MWEYVDDGFHIQFSLFILSVVILSRLITILVLCFICEHSCAGFNMPYSEQLGFTLGTVKFSAVQCSVVQRSIV